MDSKEYSIVASAEAFETLSSKLYTNPVAAVIRELSCNAYDSQVMAGTEDRPFLLHLPTFSEEYFKIRDYGLGMSDEFVMNVFTTYFASTKNNSEDQIGAFGLGSKTPYALVDEYFVDSFYEGKKLSYKMSKKNGCPVVERVSEEVSDEPNGLSIMFSLEEKWNDSYQTNFQEEAMKFFYKSKFQPDWNLDLPEENKKNMALSKYFYNDNNVILSGEDESFLFRRYYDPKLTINVAGVVFGISNYEITNIPDFYSSVNLMANKNDVTVTPSREDLHYDEKTINFINQKIAEVINDKNLEISKKIEEEEISFSELRNLSNLELPDISEKAKNLLEEVFEPMTFLIEGRSVKRLPISRCNSYYRYNENLVPYFGLLNSDGCKNVQLNTIKSTLEESLYESKISSKTFCDRVKFFFDSRVEDSRERRILVAKEGQKDRAIKILENEKNLYDDFVYIDCVPSKKEGTKTRRGFITQSTYIYRKYSETGEGYRRSTINPSIKEGEIALVIDANRTGKFTDYFHLLKRIKPDAEIVLRVCKEEGSIKNICSANPYAKNALEWAISTIKENKGMLQDCIKVSYLRNELEKFDIYPVRYEKENIDKIVSLKNKYNKNIDDLIDDILFVNGNEDLIDYSGKIEEIFKEDKENYKIVKDEKKYPMLKWIRNNYYSKDAFEYIKDMFEYMSLVDTK